MEGGEGGDCPRSMNHQFLRSMDQARCFPGKEAATPLQELAQHVSRNPHNSQELLTAEQLPQVLHSVAGLCSAGFRWGQPAA